MTDFEHAREHMVDNQLRTSNITDRRILAVMSEVPREQFVPQSRRALAYSDAEHDLEAANGRRLASPAPFARLIQLAEIESTDIVLDIACGTGYSTAVLSQLASAVVGVEDDQALAAEADRLLTELEIGNAAVLSVPLTAGVPSEAPFNVIVIEGEVETIPPALFDQLREGGRLVAYERRNHSGTAVVYVKSGGEVTAREEFDSTMPELDAFSRPREFAL